MQVPGTGPCDSRYDLPMTGVQHDTKRRPDVGDRYRLTRSAFDVVSAFGCLRARALPGPVIVAVLAEHGYSSSSVHNQLVRMVNRGIITSRRHGRVGVYRLGEQLLSGFMDISGESRAPGYEGRLHAAAYSIPETERLLRDRFQYTARYLGYRQLRPGLMIGFADGSAQLHAQLPLVAAPSWFETFTIEPENVDSARRMTAQAFELAAALQELPGLEAQLSELSCGGAAPGGGVPEMSITKFFDLYFAVARAVLAHPILPTELVGADQPARRFRELMSRCNLEYLLRFDQRVLEIAGSSSSFDLIEWLPVS